VGGGVQLGPPGTVATSRPTVPAPGDYDDGEIGGMMIGRGNQSTQRKHASVMLNVGFTSTMQLGTFNRPFYGGI
jgi:hypothetical protein